MFVVNIPRPYPETDENEKIISYIEPLIKSKDVEVSHAYAFNLKQFMDGNEPSLSPGFAYMFWFTDELLANEFCKKFNGHMIESL